MVETHQPTIGDAIDIIDEEIATVRTERDAFETFRDRLDGIDPSGGASSGTQSAPLGGTVTSHSATPRAIRAVRRAYRETVMATPHYEDAYGEPLRESLAAEFTASLAAGVADAATLTPTVHRLLTSAAEQARRTRENGLACFRRERRSLVDCRDELNDIEATAHGLWDGTGDDVDRRLAALAERCDDLAARRQDLLHSRSASAISGVEGTSLVSYLYADDLGTACPVLADLADCRRTVEASRR